MTTIKPDYSQYSADELWDAWMWVDDRLWPERAVELYQRVYGDKRVPPPSLESKRSNPILTLFARLVAVSREPAAMAIRADADRALVDEAQKKRRVEALIKQRATRPD